MGEGGGGILNDTLFLKNVALEMNVLYINKLKEYYKLGHAGAHSLLDFLLHRHWALDEWFNQGYTKRECFQLIHLC